MDTFIGMVMRTDGSQMTVRDDEGQDWRCVLRGRLRRELAGATNPVAVGDRVEATPTARGEGAVDRLLPRRSRLARRAVTGHDARGRGRGAPRPREHVVAVNLDLAVVVVAAPPRPTVADRYLAMAAAGDCAACLCINKIDLVERPPVDAAAAAYRDAGVAVLLTSAATGDGLDQLRSAIAGRLVAFIGPSGAGKSSLLNALDPTLRLRTGELNVAGKGSHTTTWVATVQIGDALVVDTPGLREIGFLADEGAGATDELFPNIIALGAGCRFRDCTHTHEPRCAVKDAVDSGALNEALYQRYARLARSGRA